MTITQTSHRESRRDMTVSHGCPDPTRPIPVVTEVCGALADPSIEPPVGPAPSAMDGAPRRHVHRFVPAPDGRLFGKVRYRNRCRCGELQHPPAPRPLKRGPLCTRCGFPTAAGTVDEANPLHPCCAEPGLMALGRKVRLTRLKEAVKR